MPSRPSHDAPSPNTFILTDPMKAAQLQRFRQAAVQGSEGQGNDVPSVEEGGEGPSFRDTLESAVDQVNEAQETANEKVSAFVAGEEQNLHEVMISMNQAKLQFELMNEVRSRSLEAYKQLMRMRI